MQWRVEGLVEFGVRWVGAEGPGSGVDTASRFVFFSPEAF